MSPEQKHQTHYKKQRQKTRKKVFRKWHRRMGFAASLFLFNLAITGIVLNHYESFNLHKKYIQSELILDWYNIQAPTNLQCLSANKITVCQVGDLIFDAQLNFKNHVTPRLLQQSSASLVNIFSHQQNYYLITSHAIFILNHQMQLIDKLDLLNEFEINITAAAWQQNQNSNINQTSQQLILQGIKQSLLFNLDDEEITVLPDDHSLAKQPLLEPLSPLLSNQLKASLKQAYKQRQISWLKLVQDLHSGQILSSSGKLLTDLVGIIILLLAISGFITWQRRKNNSKDN